MRTTVVTLIGVGLLASSACRKSTTPPDAGSESTTADAPADDGEGEGEVVGSTQLDTTLPDELVAELRLAGADANGRLLTLAPGFIATAACSDCGAPSYLWFVAVRCADERHCEVLTEVCSGTIGREADTFAVEFHPVDGAAADANETCAGYSGTFEPP
jgi:hypothetical protein